MNTQVLPVNEESIALAAKLLQQGELVALPTETVYGIAADARNGEAVKKIFEAKGRPQDNPLIVHICGRHMPVRCSRRTHPAQWKTECRFPAIPAPLLRHVQRQTDHRL